MAARGAVARLAGGVLRAAEARAVEVRHLRTTAAAQGGAGTPVGQGAAPEQPLPEEHEMTWDDGSPNPETALDTFNLVSSEGALGMLAAGFGLYGAIMLAAKFNDKASRVPFTPREYPGVDASFGK